jgi:hypothetical protein
MSASRQFVTEDRYKIRKILESIRYAGLLE